MHSTNQKVVIAMSGGVDSSVAALRLQEAGHEVIGLWMQVQGEGPAAEEPAFRQALRIAQYLNIPLTPIDLRSLFEVEVVEYFLREYLNGKTPNPCALCNPRFKFGLLLENALQMGAELFATGHYARIDSDPLRERLVLLRGVDRRKDQSYFLWGLSQEQLAHSRFPNGELTKAEVRRIAQKGGVPLTEEGESQEICFIPHGDYRAFLQRRLADRIGVKGEIVDTAGQVLGKHEGIFGFTIGQRRRIGVPARRPYYVLRIEPAFDRVVVGDKEDLLARGLVAQGMHWISIPPPHEEFRAVGQIRYRHAAAPCQVIPRAEDTVVVRFDEPQEAITPGQALVLYQDDRVLGGGWIREVEGGQG
ncbi:MAG: tRNA 2-thiouridine(34) synthase MnmA [Deltaproteobacteria bacterium]|nr:tRNA 2-thiouridine(34) synthase MnmA [Deltaproteobacteria bacterium]